ncbi:unnamed protein product [Closterium sp. NIES-54]
MALLYTGERGERPCKRRHTASQQLLLQYSAHATTDYYSCRDISSTTSAPTAHIATSSSTITSSTITTHSSTNISNRSVANTTITTMPTPFPTSTSCRSIPLSCPSTPLAPLSSHCPTPRAPSSHPYTSPTPFSPLPLPPLPHSPQLPLIHPPPLP